MALSPIQNRCSVTGGNDPAKKHGVRSLTELPPELQSKILVRLPVKSLLSCKCVCKSLRDLISNPSFVKSHLNRINSPPESAILQFGEKELMLYTRNPNNIFDSKPVTPLLPQILDPKYNGVFIVGSCNGLIVIGATFGTIFKMDYVLILWNPVIRQHRFLPAPRFKCFSFHGFGFIPEMDDYVVIKVSSIQKVIEVYRMSSDSWTIIDCSSREPDVICKICSDGDPVYLNGSFHWTKESIDDTDIVYYKLKDEELGVIKATNYNEVSGYDRSFIQKKVVVVDHSLAIIYWATEETFPFEMWVMNDYGVEETWTRRFLIQQDVSNYLEHSLAGLWGNDLIIIKESGTLNAFSTLLLYDLNTRSRINIARMEKFLYITGFSNYVETLVPVIKGDWHGISSVHEATQPST